MRLFLGEAIVLAAIGGLRGLLLGGGIAWLLHALLPALPVHVPVLYVVWYRIPAKRGAGSEPGISQSVATEATS